MLAGYYPWFWPVSVRLGFGFHGDHDFRHEQAPPPKIDARKAALIQQALEKAAMAPDGVPAVAAAIPDLEPIPEPVAEMAAPAVSQATVARPAARKSARAK